MDGSTVIVSKALAQLSLQRLSLEVLEGPDAGLKHPVEDDKLVIGSHEGADLVLKDDAVSRFHCELRSSGDRVLLVDLDSSNGTRLDGVSVLQAHLRDGSLVELGRTKLKVSFTGDRFELPLGETSRFGQMVGSSAPMRRAFERLSRGAESDATVLLLGETGTGKEAAAESIHEASKRRDGPFVVVDCGAIPGQLLESELFGHLKGSFTGATTDRPGAFAAANGGTLFLDEIGELGIELQPKLLRVLERRHVKKVGSSSYEPVDVRIVAATHRDLKAGVNRREFRADLYYRLAVVEIRLPPLRERLGDLPELVDHLMGLMGVGDDHPFAGTLRDPAFLRDLGRHAWPGNVRELRNFLERCVALRERAEPAALGDGGSSSDPAVDPSVPLRQARDRWVAHFERRYLESLLEAHDGNVSSAARAAGVNRGHLYRLLSRHELK